MEWISSGSISWNLQERMTSGDVIPSVEQALQFTGLSRDTAPRLLSDNGKCYLSTELS